MSLIMVSVTTDRKPAHQIHLSKGTAVAYLKIVAILPSEFDGGCCWVRGCCRCSQPLRRGEGEKRSPLGIRRRGIEPMYDQTNDNFT